MYTILSLILALGVGFGFAFWLFATLLEKSNNMGDYHASQFEYEAIASYTITRDNISKADSESLVRYCCDPLEPIPGPPNLEKAHVLSEEELQAYKEAGQSKVGEFIEPSAGGSRMPLKPTAEDEFQAWENSLTEDEQNAPSPFKPLN